MPAIDVTYVPALDGLRAVAILLVVLSHLGLGRILPGAFGVTLFFFISGYLISRQLLATLGLHGRVDLAGFYLRRALRLMPTALSYILIAGLLFAAAGGGTSAGGWLAALFYGANYYALFHGYGGTLAGVRHPFDILWSLAIEEHFYLLWPFVLGRLGVARNLPWILLCACAAGLAWRWIAFDTCIATLSPPGAPFCAPANPDPALRDNQLYLATFARLDSIAWGALLAVLEARGYRAPSSAFATLAAGVALAACFAGNADFARYVLRPSWQGGALFFLVPALLAGDTAARRYLAAPAAIFIGRLSYALYLWHWGSLAFADWASRRFGVPFLAAALPAIVVTSLAAYAGIEKPMRRYRRRAGSQAPR
jgi:peptidoglycan/LPS O-acetylase OafA/YrhL